MQVVNDTQAIQKHFKNQSQEIQNFMEHLPKLLDDFPLDVSLVYLFARIEKAHNRALCHGLVKRHKTDKEFTLKILQNEHLTREGFRTLFKAAFKHDVDNKALKFAEKIRDNAVHGKGVEPSEIRNAILKALDYATGFETLVLDDKVVGFNPFGDLRGFKGRAGAHSAETTRWILKGMGFSVQ